MGNSRARAVYEALLSDNFRRPQTDSGLESFIRSKYEQKKYIAREWIPPPFPPKVDWDKEIDEELENQKRKKKAASSGSSTIIQEPPKSKPITSSAGIIPAPLPKPAHSPKSSRLSSSSSSAADAKKIANSSSNSTDLLGLDTSLTNATASAISMPTKDISITDTFDFFADSVIAPPSSIPTTTTIPTTSASLSTNSSLAGATDGLVLNNNENSLKKEEDDFFNQKTIDNNGLEKGKLTKDNILALYGKSTVPSPFQPAVQQPQVQPFNANFHQPAAATAIPQDSLFFGVAPTSQNLFSNKQQQHFIPVAGATIPNMQPPPPMFNGNNGNNFIGNVGFGTMQSQQINRLNEENIRKIESLNFNNFNKKKKIHT